MQQVIKTNTPKGLQVLNMDININDSTTVNSFLSRPFCIKLFIMVVNGLVISPSCVFFWASMWDIIWLLEDRDNTPENIPYSFLICLVISHMILLIIYMGQHSLQRLHNSFILEGKKMSSFLLRLVIFLIKLLNHYQIWYIIY